MKLQKKQSQTKQLIFINQKLVLIAFYKNEGLAKICYQTINLQFKHQMKKMYAGNIVLIAIILLYVAESQILASVNFSNIISKGDLIYTSKIGLTYDLPTLMPYFVNPLLTGYLKNTAQYQDQDYLFWQHIHTPIGYKYGCNSASLYGGAAINCTVDLSFNSSQYQNMNIFFFEVGQFRAVNLGWDMEKANFSRTTYRTNMANFYYNLWGNWVNIELIDMGDKLTNYTATNLLSDTSRIASATYYTAYIFAPGLTENQTSDTWWNSISTFTSSNNMGVFTLRCVLFKTLADATIANLMSDNYVDAYITKRLTQPNGTYNDPKKYKIALSDIRLTGTAGVNGVTNSFAAALWALDFSLKYMSIGGFFASFYTPFTASNESVLGAAPYFGPQALYYGLLFANYAVSQDSTFITPNVTAVGSQFIKVYAFSLYTRNRVVLINKDLNPSSNGTVEIVLSYSGPLECLYMQADNLSSTGITIANISFVSNSSDFVGLWSTSQFLPLDNGTYQIPIRYAQVAICTTISKTGYNQFPRKSTLTNSQAFLRMAALMLAALLMM